MNLHFPYLPDMALQMSKIEDHTFDWLRAVSISGLGQTMNGRTYRKEVDIGLGGGWDKPLRPADMLFYSWDGGIDVYADLTRSSPLTHTVMVYFVSGSAVIEAAQRNLRMCSDLTEADPKVLHESGHWGT
ncbi:hypothetical protein Tco_0090875 [Tanacetum coccineum]